MNEHDPILTTVEFGIVILIKRINEYSTYQLNLKRNMDVVYVLYQGERPVYTGNIEMIYAFLKGIIFAMGV